MPEYDEDFVDEWELYTSEDDTEEECWAIYSEFLSVEGHYYQLAKKENGYA